MDMKNEIIEITTQDVERRLISLRGQRVLLDKDVADLYGVQTKEINQAVKNNPKKFRQGYILELTEDESAALRSNFLTIENDGVKTGRYSKYRYKAFTEKGLYMLATILKSDQATETTVAIIETFALVRHMARMMEQLQDAADGGEVQRNLLQKTGELLAEVVGRNLSTESTETEIELNFAVVKIKHKVVKKK